MRSLETQSDESLMVRITGGDHQAFATLVRRHSGRFYAGAYRMCGNVQDSEDIVQEAFLKIWNRPEMWDARRGVRFTTWFYKVVTNLALDHLRKKKQGGGPEDLSLFADDRAGQDQILEQRQEEEALEEAIQILPERQKAALNLCFHEGLSNREAADILGVGVKALESLLIRAKTGLRDELIRRGFIFEQEKKYG